MLMSSHSAAALSKIDQLAVLGLSILAAMIVAVILIRWLMK